MNGCSYTIQGKEVGLYFGIPALSKMMERQLKFPAVGEFAGISFIANMLNGGYYCNCEIEDINVELKYKDFYLHIEEEIANGGYSEQTLNAFKVYENSTIVKGRSGDAPVADPEKKN